VAHILACSASNGQTSVWDLRQKRAVITFTESSHRHVPATAVAWDPTQARQLVVSYAYPAAEVFSFRCRFYRFLNVVQVWDLRYGMAPKQILQGGHSRGSILTVAWSQYDSNIILTSGILVEFRLNGFLKECRGGCCYVHLECE
jgi:protein transport protein SEC31